MQQVTLPDGETVPALGQGTWYMGERAARRAEEARTLKHGIGLGMTLIDTAEMYAEGGAEEVVGDAIEGQRDAVFVVSKVYPHNASKSGTVQACERSLKRLRTDRIDLYLLHWRGRYPLSETVAAMEGLKAAGKIRHWGVSNLDTDDMEELASVPNGGNCAANQILLNLTRRGPEFDLLPWCKERGMPVMAYSPIEQGRMPAQPALEQVGKRHGVDRFAVALAWVLSRPGVIAIPKAGSLAHVEANRKAAEIELSPEDHQLLDQAFPPPRRKVSLAML
ncbi:MAG TPA: aldo/keto reductase [Geminicoccus sp.]|jgi:diketogulonate reductase-like aldo/keto reductase|uniref:aldo/keto reductase n=1 Tax=Geminicoccus sp. TaxID=2024832 RepID=UPI002E2FC994|nr:aldo/keto reductase [Geminicoccus sp.]HEX2529035.1 aldo/keto reductase [Geminicoccus sp.]